MKPLLFLYDRLILGLAQLAAASLGLITVLIVYDVLSRNLALPPFQAVSAIVEYVLLFATMAAAPWLVRVQGNVALTSFVQMLPHGVHVWVNRVVLVLSVVALLFLTWVSASLTLHYWRQGTIDMRSVNMPGWLLYAFLSGGFLLMACEFLRLLARGEIYSGDGGGH
ncbi:C4-dicarboxylate ABC transporter permease [Thioclava dalianensis]|uniref:TRAP transporter small permease protein n=1 Tax=Thioclava dalianensis TaxID=1185766 RepID=A0A074THK5_9RHOB|nr:TRAP transporter small permease subunit [Thioclava dalianensis]KEP71139.1 C4-dicarboxylate ABC transporter permease [Thioclava dalianensis]SFN24128.1 TRAP-type C4-dicarboxylate transport system, small permease component [Thioclava dalianensis]